MLWASEQEKEEQFLRETLPVDGFGVYFHPGGCQNCGTGPCYMLCPNHPAYYSPEQEREDSLYNDSLTSDQWFRLAVVQYEQAHGVAYVS